MRIGITFLREFPSLLDALKETLGVSPSGIKKYFPGRKYLREMVKARETYHLSIDLLNRNSINPEYEGPSGIPLPEIIFQDDHVLALNKPPFVHSHPLRYGEKDNCLSFLRQTLHSSLLAVNEGSYDRGLLYRLDFGTSGILVYIKKEELLRELRRDFHQRIKEKIYLCIVEGEFNREGTHSHLLVPASEKGKRMRIWEQKGGGGGQLKGHLAVSEFKKLLSSSRDSVSLVAVKIKTGVRHQIRAQLSQLGFPILGDELYGGKREDRIYLHAHKYTFETDKKQYSFMVPHPYLFDRFFDFDSVLQMLDDLIWIGDL